MQSDDVQVGPVWTHPDYRSRGFASAVLANCLLEAAAKNRRSAWWLCRDENNPSNRLAAAAGLHRVASAVKGRLQYVLQLPVSSYVTVTEVPGQRATVDQSAMQHTRYGLAAQFANGGRVLEIGCGTGMGLGLLSKGADTVVGGDIDDDNCRIALLTYRNHPHVGVSRLDAHHLPFPDACFREVLLFEAIYYLKDPRTVLREALRVLEPEGVILISTVNCDWRNFNPSPLSVHYLNVRELRNMFAECGLQAELLAGFPDKVTGVSARLLSAARKIAVKLNLMPKTMKGKQWLKRIVFGDMRPMAAQISEDAARPAPLLPVEQIADLRSYRVLYAIARMPARSPSSASHLEYSRSNECVKLTK